MPRPATMMPVSSLCSLLVTAGSTPTTTLFISGMCPSGMRVCSSSSRVHNAPSTSSTISAYSSCRPSVVPPYRSLSAASADGARFSALSNVLPVVICTSLRLIMLRIISVGLGVVVMTHWGLLPKRNPKSNWSNVSGYRHAASSSHHAL